MTPLPRSSEDSPQAFAAWTVACLAVAAALAYFLYLAREAVLLIYVSVLFAMGISPVVRLLERQTLLPIGTRRLPRWLAILTLYALILGVLTMLLILTVPQVVKQATELWERLPEMLDGVQTFLINRGLLDHRITLGEAMRRAPGGADAVGALVGTVWGIAGGVFGLVTVLILTFYLLVQADSIVTTWVRLFPARNRLRVATICREITVRVSAWLGGQLFLATIIGAATAVWLALLSVPYFSVLALIAGIGEFIPIVGPILGAIPAVGVALTVSPKLALVVLVLYTVQQQVESNLLVPKVMERQVGVNAVTVMIALLVGGNLLGVLGVLLAVPTAAILQVLFEELVDSRAESDHPAA